MNNIVDTIKIRYDFVKPEQRNQLINWLMRNNESCREILEMNRLPKYQCDIKNLRLYINHQSIYISGSIQKFYVGNNISEIGIENIITVFDTINEYLGNTIDTKLAFVRRIDFGINILMKHSPSLYISKLYNLSAKKTIRYNNQTLTTGNKSKGITVYDKTAEVNEKNKYSRVKANVPKNLLRIESHINGRKVFEKIFGQQLPTVNTVMQQIDKLPDILYDSYLNLDKSYESNVKGIKNKNELLYYTITVAGLDKCQYMINYSYDNELIDKQNRYRLNRTVKDAFKYYTKKDDDAITELDNKVNQWYNNLKEW